MKTLTFLSLISISVIVAAPASLSAGDTVNNVPVVVERVLPEYPVAKTGERHVGTVLVEGLVLENGTLVGATAIDAPSRELANAAVEAVKQWRFQPAVRDNGQPAETVVRFPVHFTAPKDSNTVIPLLAFR